MYRNAAINRDAPRFMRDYRRPECPGATLFFTVVTHLRRPIFRDGRNVALLRHAVADEMQHHPFAIHAAVILPDHLHCIWTLPSGDDRLSLRWSKIKGRFTELFLAAGGHEELRNASRHKRGEHAVWQRRFWDHVVCDDTEYAAYMDYLHYNPVKHGLARCPQDWPFSSFRRQVEAGRYNADWACVCPRRADASPASSRVNYAAIEHLVGE